MTTKGKRSKTAAQRAESVNVATVEQDAPIIPPVAPGLSHLTIPMTDAQRAAGVRHNLDGTTSPIPPVEQDAPIIPPVAPVDKKEAARLHFLARQSSKAQRISALASLTSTQKETARVILTQETERRTLINVGRDADVSDDVIFSFDKLLASGDRHVRAITPRFYHTAPKWLDAKTWARAKRAFCKLYASDGPSAFDRDEDGRLIMSLPMTPGRYMGAVVVGDVATVLHFAGTWSPTKDSTFAMLAAIDHCAPIIATVYRAGSLLNAADQALGKAQGRLDNASADDILTLTQKRDLCSKGLDTARTAFVKAYRAAIRGAESLTKQAQDAAIAHLSAFVAAPTAAQAPVAPDAPIIPPVEQDAAPSAS